jgi:hypothetical protein
MVQLKVFEVVITCLPTDFYFSLFSWNKMWLKEKYAARRKGHPRENWPTRKIPEYFAFVFPISKIKTIFLSLSFDTIINLVLDSDNGLMI